MKEVKRGRGGGPCVWGQARCMAAVLTLPDNTSQQLQLRWPYLGLMYTACIARVFGVF